MKIVDAKICKSRKAHHKTEYTVVLTIRRGWWIFAITDEMRVYPPQNSWSSAFNFICKTYPKIKKIQTIGDK